LIFPETPLPAAPARGWSQILARYREPSTARSVTELAITAAPLVALWAAAWFAYHAGSRCRPPASWCGCS